MPTAHTKKEILVFKKKIRNNFFLFYIGAFTSMMNYIV